MKARIDKPCPEDWDKMKIGLHSRFCEKCEKNVMDFTNKSRQEILEYLLTNYDKRVCGRIYPSQLDFSHTDFVFTVKAISKKNKNPNLAFYLLSMGTLFLASCTNPKTSQDDNKANDTVISAIYQKDTTFNSSEKDSIESDTIKEELKKTIEFSILGGMKLHNAITDTVENDNSEVKCDKAVKSDTIKKKLETTIEISTTMGIMKVSNDETDSVSIEELESKPATTNEEKIYEITEKMPEFVGGIEKLDNYIQENLKYPKWEQKNKIEGVVLVQFVVDKEGKIRNPKIIKSVNNSKNFDSEVLRLVKSMPTWIPAEHNGQKVNVKFNLPIRFQL